MSSPKSTGIYHDPRHEGSIRFVIQPDNNNENIMMYGSDKDSKPQSVWSVRATKVNSTDLSDIKKYLGCNNKNNIPTLEQTYCADFNTKDNHKGHKQLLFFVTDNFIFWEDGNVWIKLHSPFNSNKKMDHLLKTINNNP